MEKIEKYIEENKDRFLSELLELLRIPSISADSKYKEEVLRAAEVVKSAILSAGADSAEVCLTEGHPVVYGEKTIDESLPTVLVYGHYDVQPVDPLNLWDSPPFEPQIKDGNIYARGASDDKGQMFMHVKALELMIKTNSLPCNVKFMIEGEEEVGSTNLGIFVKNNKEKLKADIILVSDTSMIAKDVPSITVGLRGLSYVEAELTGPDRDLHSGHYGGAVGNPINILCKMIDSLIDRNGRIIIPGFYHEVVELSAGDRAEMSKVPFDLETYKKELNVDDIVGEEGYSAFERSTIRPSLDVNGIWGGYTGDGAKTVLPSKASAKISMRLVPNQNSAKITELFMKHFEALAPDAVKIKMTAHHGGEPVITPSDSIAYMAASRAMEDTFGKKPIPVRGGGSIPIIALFEKELGLKSILMGFGLESDNIHSPNEHFGVLNFLKGIETIPLFYRYYANQ